MSLIQSISHILLAKNWKLALAESCTGGLVCAKLTELSGSSAWFERGYITYSNLAKTECLDVPAELIERFGAVSEPVAKAMALGALTQAGTQVGLSITGIAGPTGGSPEKPVGTVCFGWAISNASGEKLTFCQTQLFDGDRSDVREQAAQHALTELLQLLSTQ